MTFGSLFAGIGGFDLGFERAGMRCVWQVEIDDYANRVLAKHWPRVKRWRDIRTWPQPDTERPDVICGGFPCQDISYAGRGAGLDGARSGLFFEAVRVVRELRPRVVVLENVAGLLTRGLDRVLGTLAEIGFDAEWHCLPAAAFGAPHIRDRVFVIAYSESERFGTRRSRGTAGACPREEDAPILAHAESQGRQGQRVAGAGGGAGGGEHSRGGSCGGGGSKDVPDADNAGRRRGEKRRSSGDGKPLLRGKVGPVSGHTWETEPDVGRVAARFSFKLDGGLTDESHKSCQQKASTAGLPSGAAMSEVRMLRERAAASQGPPRCAICGVPLSEVPYHRRSETWEMGKWHEESKGVLYLRSGVHELHAFASENVQQGVLVGDWQNQCTQTMANQTDRLRGLGNAVVPQVAEWIGKRIVEACQ